MKTEAAKYFYTTSNGRRGPVGFDELRALAVAGTLTRRQKVWCKGMAGWETADTIDGLFSGLPPDLDTETHGEMSPDSEKQAEQSVSCTTEAISPTPPNSGSKVAELTPLLRTGSEFRMPRAYGVLGIVAIIVVCAWVTYHRVSNVSKPPEYTESEPTPEGQRIMNELRARAFQAQTRPRETHQQWQQRINQQAADELRKMGMPQETITIYDEQGNVIGGAGVHRNY